MVVGITYAIVTCYALYLFYRIFASAPAARLLAIWTILTPAFLTFAAIMGCLVMFFYVDETYWYSFGDAVVQLNGLQLEGRELWQMLLVPFEGAWYFAKLWYLLMVKFTSIPLIIFHVLTIYAGWKAARISWIFFGPKPLLTLT